ncbi:hypothetical protein PASE110613_07885 [Paenibacillus sediminis]|uniref:DUF2507 domain-containing protein n=1 Tax=Paenibacillus sediminis TaxID=664909 RepID=A0ABS4H2J2_9BACL|nr:hypothetical protein [Paenibacillus sediminis]MBP1936738.1 hypothetical protein [Paenibacillus sediminis]
MERVRLPQPVAVRLEGALSFGVEQEQLLNMIDQGDFTELTKMETELFGWESLIEFASTYPDDLRRAITEGYEYRFTTKNGLKLLLLFKFLQQAEEHYTEGPDYFDQVKLTASEAQLIRSMITKNWKMIELGQDERQGEAHDVTRLYRFELANQTAFNE